MGKTLCISADSHVVEPPELFEPLKAKYGDRAPQIVNTSKLSGPQLALGNGKRSFPIGVFFQTETDFSSDESITALRRGYDLARPGCYDVAERVKDQDHDGVDAEVLYPSILFFVYQLDDVNVVQDTFAAYNDWVTAYCKPAPNRLFALGALQLRDLDLAIKEMERAKAMGHVGVCIPATAPPDMLYADKWYDKFWAAAQDLEMPLAMHEYTGATPDHGLAPRARISRANRPMAFAGMAMTIADVIQSRVCERFPGLKFVVTEFETGWIAHVLRRLDWAYYRTGERIYGLPRLPSSYWHTNFSATFEDDPLGILTRDYVGVNTLMWGSDYPHGDSIFPHSRQVLSEILDPCSEDERWRMTVKNVVNLYKLPFELEGPQQAMVNHVPAPEVKTWRDALPLTQIDLTTPAH